MLRKYAAAAALFGGTGVALGAFGAHGLQKITTDEKIVHSYATGVQYQLYHALVLLAIALLIDKIEHRFIKWAGNCFMAGVFLFCGSLYLLTVFKIQGSAAVKFVGPITPIGGIIFVAGWVFLFLAAISRK
jgi:uncharacterized membrane protein YgdD (TMEM256/DUF423 family)